MAKRKESAYSQKLKDPRWQKLRLQVLEAAEWKCQLCLDSESTLFVHHNYYTSGKEPWEYPPEDLCAYCEECHIAADAQRVEWQAAAGPFSFDERESLIHIVNCFRVMNRDGRWLKMEHVCDLLNEMVREKVGGAAARLMIAEVTPQGL